MVTLEIYELLPCSLAVVSRAPAGTDPRVWDIMLWNGADPRERLALPRGSASAVPMPQHIDRCRWEVITHYVSVDNLEMLIRAAERYRAPCDTGPIYAPIEVARRLERYHSARAEFERATKALDECKQALR